MPTYEYRCKDCGHELEAYQSFTADPLTDCPSCTGALKKVFGNVGITFKGSGFYKTDSRSGANGSNGARPSADSGGSDAGGPDSGSSSSEVSSSDAKSSAKGDSKSSGDSKSNTSKSGSNPNSSGAGKSGAGKSGAGKSAAKTGS